MVFACSDDILDVNNTGEAIESEEIIENTEEVLESENASTSDLETVTFPEIQSVNIQTINSETQGNTDVLESGGVLISSALSLGINAEMKIMTDGSESYHDALHFTYFSIDSDHQLVIQVNTLSAAKRKSKLGLMVRAGLSNDDSFAAILLNDIGKIQFSSRKKRGSKGQLVDITNSSLPLWLKLIRRGANVTAYYSEDNLNWHFVGVQSIASTQRVYIGLTAFSADISSIVEAELESLHLTKLPSFDVNGGVYQQPVTVTLKNRQAQATYYYSLDGTPPDIHSPLFTDLFMINEDTTLMVAEYINGVLQDTLSAYFVIKDNDENVHYRPLHFSYGGVGGDKRLIQSDTVILNALMTTFPKKPTLLTPVILNEDPALFEPFISKVKQIVPSIYFGVGFAGRHNTPTEFPRDYQKVIELAEKFRIYSDAIRIEAFDNIIDISGDQSMDGEAYMVKLLDQLHAMGFTQIMANPWVPRPYNEEEGDYQQWPHLTSVFIGTGSTQWGAPIGRINKVYQHNPALNIIINYENAPRHIELSGIEASYQAGENALSSLDIMYDLTDRQVLKDTLKEGDTEIDAYFKWSAPWSQNYDPIALGTLDWIGERLTELNP